MSSPATKRLLDVLQSFERLAIAVSGGVDSMTLAHLAFAKRGDRATIYHAVSPAVPPEATERVRGHALRHGWPLRIIDAGEFTNPAYLDNPVDRCFFCKQDLYGTIRTCTTDPIASGTNLDDLGDYRPGLIAAERHGVRHPFVEARIDKAGVRALASSQGLDDLADLPAAPCLSSRIETGIPVTAGRLALVLEVERLVTRMLGAGTARCRIRREGLVVELGAELMFHLEPQCRSLQAAIETVQADFGQAGPIHFAPYRQGSAFLRTHRA
jgi:pyridinium-3,5-biscarboxylic acid mononucleotide sulfurtransferase